MPFVCGTDVSVEISTTKLPIRTRGDGKWKKYTYQDCTFTITLSGLLTFDEDNWTGWDMLDNQFNFSHLLVRVSFDDGNGDIRTVQGYVMIETATLSFAPGALVKDDFQLQGNGKLDMFDGFIPCDAVITGFTTEGLDDSDGNVEIDYTYTGAIYQVKYRVDSSGDYLYALPDHTLTFTLPIGAHELEIIPICQNGYEGTGFTAPFIVTHGLTCSTVISDVTITDTSATAVYTGSATQMRYRIDGGMWATTAIISPIINSLLSVGAHTIEMVPLCSNGVLGTGFIKAFTVASNPSQSIINYNFRFPDTPNTIAFRIYVNGVLNVSTGVTATGLINVSTGSTVKFEMEVGGGREGDMTTTDQTTSTVLDTRGGSSSFTIVRSYTFTANGDEYLLDGQINDL